MSQVKVSGNASGTGIFEIAAPNSNTNRTLTLPDGTGTFTVNGVNSNIVSGTAAATTSGTSVDITGIPSWVKRVTVMLKGVATNGSSNLQLQIGAGSVTTSGYLGNAVLAGGGNSATGVTSTTGFILTGQSASTCIYHGAATVNSFGSNIWVCTSVMGRSDGIYANYSGGSLTLGGTFDRVRLTTVNGTDTFTAGSINILYE